MEKRYDLFYKVLEKLDEEDVLKSIILVGSWCQLLYKEYYKNAPEIPALRTLDIDFLIPSPLNLPHKKDLPRILGDIGFDIEFDLIGGFTKLVHPDLEVEFLVNEKGAGNSGARKIRNLAVNAIPLRYMGIVEEFNIPMKYRDLYVKVPIPAAFVLLKLLIASRRKDKAKKEKDLESAVSIGELLLTIEHDRKELKLVFNRFHSKWKKTVIMEVEKLSESLYSFLNELNG